MKKKMVLIDGNSLFNRAFYALPLLSNKEGLFTNAIYGFATMLNQIIENYSPEYMVVAFDLKAKTFRHLESSEYKANRKGMPDELRVQVEPIKRLIDTMGISRVEIEGFEADDIIGTLSLFGEKNDLEVFVITGDKDALQLASDKTKILITKKGVSVFDEYDYGTILEKYGLVPKQMIELKALMGDKSDNIKGVAGIGEKTALKLIQDFGSVENLYENIDSVKGSIKQKLENDIESAFLSKKLATIIREIPLDFKLSELEYKGADKEELVRFYTELEFFSLISNVNKNDIIENNEEINIEIKDYSMEKIIDSTIVVDAHIEKNYSSNKFDIQMLYFFVDDVIYRVNVENIVCLKEMFEEKSNKFVSNDLKMLYKALCGYGIQISNLHFDVGLAEYVVDSNSGKYFTSDLSLKYAHKQIKTIDDLLGKGKSKVHPNFIEIEKVNNYFKDSLLAIKKSYESLYKEIDAQGLNYIFYDVEMKLIKILSDMEMEGFLIDVDLLGELDRDFSLQIKNLEQKIYDYAGEIFNINSPKQLGSILFEKLSLPHGKKTKTGYSTNIEVLEYIKDYHPVVDLIIEYRQITKLKSTYIDGLSSIIDKDTKKVYTTFSQTTASTGRLSSLDPNLQNIPIKTERGRELRKLFVAEKGYKLVDADYSQIELRILAHLSKDKVMLEAFEDNVDIHTKTASEVFGVDIGDVSSELRSAAKAVNFGIIYGISNFGLSNNLGISIQEAKDYIDQYLNKYKDIQNYFDNTISNAENLGFATTEFGRKRYIPDLKSKNIMQKNFGKRIAMNTPIQGTAADIIKITMIKVYEYLKENYSDAKMILQVHDELIIKANENDAKKIAVDLVNIMQDAVDLSVKLLVDCKVGNTWFETK